MWWPRWGVPVLLAAACAGGATPPPAADPVVPAPKPQVAGTFDLERYDAASRDVVLAFTVAACTVVKHVRVDEDAARVVIRLDLGGREGKDCTEPVRKHRTVRLAAPLGDRALYDGAVTPPQRLR